MYRLFRRELRIVSNQLVDLVVPIVFMAVFTAAMPLAFGPSPETLARLAPAILWIATLISNVLSLDRLIAYDYDDGSLDLLLGEGRTALSIAAAKAAAHWLTSSLPILATAAPLAGVLGLPEPGYAVLLGGLAVGTLSFSGIGTAIAALVLGARRGSALVPMLVLPLSLPVLVFGAAAASQAAVGGDSRTALLLLAAIAVGAVPLSIVAAAAGIRAATAYA